MGYVIPRFHAKVFQSYDHYSAEFDFNKWLEEEKPLEIKNIHVAMYGQSMITTMIYVKGVHHD